MQTLPVPPADWLIVLPVLLPLLGAAIQLMFGRRTAYAASAALLVTLGVALADAALLARVLADGPLSMTMGRWLPPFGISFTADAMGAGFALVAALLAVFCLAFAQAGRGGARPTSAFYALALVLLAGAGGAFLTGDLFNLYVWFEVLLISSFGLLVVSGAAAALDGAVKYGLLNFLGTALFLLALGLIYGALGTLNMADIIGAAHTASPAVMGSIAALLLLAFGIKAAAFPVNAWLPASYHTPPAVVSALFGGILTKVGLYALLRSLVLLLPASRDLLHPAIALVAGATLILAPLGALAETNLRRTIGYLLIGGIGAAIVGIAVPSTTGVAGAVAYAINSMLTIGALYLVAGLIETSTGETDIRRMGGLYVGDALLAGLFLVLVLSVAGVPPFLGFWPKLLLLQATVEYSGLGGGNVAADPAALPLAACLLVNAVLTLFAGGRLWALMFWRDRPGAAAAQAGAGAETPARRDRVFVVAVLTLVIVAGGLWPAPLVDLGRAAAAGLLDPRAYIAAVGLEAHR